MNGAGTLIVSGIAIGSIIVGTPVTSQPNSKSPLCCSNKTFVVRGVQQWTPFFSSSFRALALGSPWLPQKIAPSRGTISSPRSGWTTGIERVNLRRLGRFFVVQVLRPPCRLCPAHLPVSKTSKTSPVPRSRARGQCGRPTPPFTAPAPRV